jgi:hypothetical protein
MKDNKIIVLAINTIKNKFQPSSSVWLFYYYYSSYTLQSFTFKEKSKRISNAIWAKTI